MFALQILENACRAQGLNSEEYELHHCNKPLDISLVLRFTNVPNNAELVLKPATGARSRTSKVTVAVQLESGERFVGEFDAEQTLWGILEQLLSDKLSTYEPVSCVYMRKQVSGESQLKETKLRNLGVTSGKISLRATLKCRDQAGGSSEGAMEVVQSANDAPAVESIEEDNTALQMPASEEKPRVVPTTENEGSGKDTRSTSVTQTSSVQQNMEVVALLKEKDALVVKLEDMPKINFDPLPDEFFEVTKEDVMYCYSDLKRQTAVSGGRPLETQKMRERRKMLKMQKYPKTVLRICFPYDKVLVQAVFSSADTVATVKNYTQRFLTARDSKFYLYTTPPRLTLEDQLSLYDSNLSPAAVVHFGSSIKAPILNADILSTTANYASAVEIAASYRKPLRVADEALQLEPEVPTSINVPTTVEHHDSESTVPRPRPAGQDRKTTVPKWFKMQK